MPGPPPAAPRVRDVADRAGPSPPRLPERYVFLERIGVGGIGEVWRVDDRNLDRELAVKVLRPDRRSGAHAARLAREAVLTGRLQHPGVPPVVERGECGDDPAGVAGGPYFAMKLIAGRTLRDLLRDGTDPAETVSIFRRVCEAVGFAHDRGVVHRDLKPSNVMVGEHGEVQVTDWGIARDVRERDADAAHNPTGEAESGAPAAASETDSAGSSVTLIPDVNGPADRTDAAGRETVTPGDLSTARSPRDPRATLTRAGSTLGTPAYMPPEQAAGRGDLADARSDVFGLGGILCAILTGRGPFASAGAADALAASAAGDLSAAFDRLEACNGPPDLVDLCKRCLAPAPANRPSDGAAVAAAVRTHEVGLRQALEDARADRRAADVRVAEERKRRRVWVALAATAAALLLALIAGGWFYAAERAAADARAATAAGDVRTLLAQAGELRRDERYGDSVKLLAAAGLRVPAADDPVLTNLVADELAQTTFAAELDSIRSRKAPRTGTRSDAAFAGGANGAYAAAFRAYGLDPIVGDIDRVGAGIKTDPLDSPLVTALDDWAKDEADPALRARLMRVAAAADPGPHRPALAAAVDTATDAPPGERAAAADALVAAISPDDPAALTPATVHFVCRELFRLGRPAEAAKLAADAASAVATDFWLHNLAAEVLQASSPDGFGEAVGHLRAAVALRPGDATVRYNLGHVLARMGRTLEAEAAFRESLAADPADRVAAAKTWNRLGPLLEDAGRTDEAEDAYRSSLAEDPGRTAARVNLGGLLADAGRFGEAEEQFHAAVAAEPTLAPAWYNLADLLDRIDQPTQAEAAWRRLIELDPSDAEALYRLALLVRRRPEDRGEAGRLVRRAEAAGGDFPGWSELREELRAAARADGPLTAPRPAGAAPRAGG